MLLIAMKQDCKIYFDGIEKDFFGELALDLDEDEENVKVTCQFLMAQGLMTTADNVEYELVACQTMVGKEDGNTKNVRAYRERQKQKLLQCKNNVRECKADVIECKSGVRQRREEKRREDIDKSRVDIEIESEEETAPQKERKRSQFYPPTVDEVKAYCQERGNSVDAERFCDFYGSKGWMVGKSKMKDWKCAVRNWERDAKQKQAEANKPVIKKTAFSNFTERQRTPEEWANLERLLL